MDMEKTENIEPAMAGHSKKYSKNYLNRIKRLQITSSRGEISSFQTYTKHHQHFTSDYEWKVEQIDTGADFEIDDIDIVSDILTVGEILFVVSMEEETCLVFIEGGDRRVRLIEGVVDVLYNPHTHAVIALCIDEDSIHSLHSMPLESIQSSELGQELFGPEYDVRFPEIDVICSRGIFFSTTKKEFVVFDLNQYKILFIIQNGHHSKSKAKLSMGKHILIYTWLTKGAGHMYYVCNIRLYSKEDGALVLDKNVRLRDEAAPSRWNRDDIELCSEKIVIHAGHWIVDIYNCSNHAIVSSNTNIGTTQFVMHLNHHNSFLTCLNARLAMWELDKPLNPNGGPHLCFEAPHLGTFVPFVSEKQDILITGYAVGEVEESGIYVSDMKSGQVLCRIDIPLEIIEFSVLEYDEENHQIFAAGNTGVYRWRPSRVDR